MSTPVRIALATLTLALVAPSAARAQEFPADDAFVPFECGDDPMTDPAGDVAGLSDEHDVVGLFDAPAALRAWDDDFLYLRLRLAADPVDGGGDLVAGGWGFELDLDDDDGAYEVQVFARGDDQSITLSRNETVDAPDDPADPPDLPPIASTDFADHGRSAATASAIGGGDDRFLDLAVAWDDLAEVGLAPQSVVGVWAGTAIDDPPLAFDADVACHDGALGTASLSDVATGPRPIEDEGGDGTGGDGRVEGGGGCEASGSASRHALLLVAALLVLRRRR